MKKINLLLLLLIILLLSIAPKTKIKVEQKKYLKTRWDIIKHEEKNMTKNLKEEIEPIIENDKVIGIKDVITIPKNINNKRLIITPSIKEGLYNYTNIDKDKIYKIEILINNKTNNTYKYKNNSLIIQTKKLKEINNYKVYKKLGFDNELIYQELNLKRTYNEPLKELLNKKELTDKNIENKLKENNYKTLDKYYLDYFNKKYNLKETNINNYKDEIIKEIFTGEESIYYETNENILRLSYNYFYNKILNLGINNKYKTIGEYMRTINNDLNNKEINNNEITVIDDFYLFLDDKYNTNSFAEYNFNTYISFVLEKNNK